MNPNDPNQQYQPQNITPDQPSDQPAAPAPMPQPPVPPTPPEAPAYQPQPQPPFAQQFEAPQPSAPAPLQTPVSPVFSGDSGAQPPQAASGAAFSTYDSNPFTNTLSSLVRVFQVNPVSTMLLSLVMLLIIVVGYFLSLILAVSLSGGGAAATALITIVLALLFAAFYVGTCQVLAAASAQGVTIKTSKILSHSLKKFLPILALIIILGVILTVGFILLIVPGFILLGRLYLAPLILVAEDVGPITAIKRSLKLSKGHTIEMLGTIFASMFVMPSSGGLLTSAAYAPAVGRYEDFKALEASGAPKPPVSKLNYLAIVPAILLFVGVILLVILLTITNASLNKTTNDTQNYYNSSDSYFTN
ncbi:MAG: hypothetical protein JWM81_330 [Candidatus Saccharibacteria bacterium]|nr:hypothetical protein [Candidatus Saccharibacteria bacterium]